MALRDWFGELRILQNEERRRQETRRREGAIEGNQPAFFRNPIYLLIGPLWLARRAAAAVGLAKKPAIK